MEQTIAFLLGVLSVLALAGVYNMFRSVVQIKDLRDELEGQQTAIDQLYRDLDNARDLLDRRIDQEIDRLNQKESKLYMYIDQRLQNTEDELNKLYGYVDSRHDKLADGVSKHIADINAKLNDNTAFVDGLHHSIEDFKKIKK